MPLSPGLRLRSRTVVPVPLREKTNTHFAVHSQRGQEDVVPFSVVFKTPASAFLTEDSVILLSAKIALN